MTDGGAGRTNERGFGGGFSIAHHSLGRGTGEDFAEVDDAFDEAAGFDFDAPFAPDAFDDIGEAGIARAALEHAFGTT